MVSETGAALSALIRDLEREIMKDLRVCSPDKGTAKSARLVDVLVFDDSDTDAYVIECILRRHGVKRMARVNDANEWEHWVSHYRPRVIVMDVVMPGKNGYEALREIVRHPTLGEIPVVICSNKNTDSDVVWALKCGAAGFVGKPLSDPKDLTASIRAAVTNARQGKRPDIVI